MIPILVNLRMDVNMQFGTGVNTNFDSLMHIAIGSNTINHDHIDAKTSICNSAVTNVRTNAGDLSLCRRPITQVGFGPSGSSWEGG